MDYRVSKVAKKSIELLNKGKPHQALALVNKSKPNIRSHIEIQKIKAATLIALEQFEESKAIWVSLLNSNIESDDIHYNLSVCYSRLSQSEKALHHAEKATSLNPNDVKSNLLLANAYKGSNQLLKQIVTLKHAHIIDQRDQEVIHELAQCLYEFGDYDSAIEYAKLLTDKYLSILIQLNCRVILNHQEEIEQLLPEVPKIFNPINVPLAVNLIYALRNAGEFDLAKELFPQVPPSNTKGYVSLKVKMGTYDNQQLNDIYEQLKVDSPELLESKDILHALSNNYFAVNELHRGYELCAQANNLTAITQDYMDSVNHVFTKIKSSYEDSNQLNHSDVNTDLPIFIVGMPRSGTTLLDSIISAHSKVASAGEVAYMSQFLNGKYENYSEHSTICNYLDNMSGWDDSDLKEIATNYIKSLRVFSTKADYIVDKMPHNFLHIGIIQKLFPRSRFIHIKRNPIACCLSIYKQNFNSFHAYGTDLDYLTEYYKKYLDLMAFWKAHIVEENFLEIDYEDLVLNKEASIEQILNFLGLDYEEACSNFHKSNRTVTTASYEQVRNDVYTSSLKPWQGSEEYIKPLLEAFPDAK